VDADHRGWRRLAAAVLLSAALDAHRGDCSAMAWLNSERAHTWAGALDLPTWPPHPGQLAGYFELGRRLRGVGAPSLVLASLEIFEAVFAGGESGPIGPDDA
jgi:hypothetical protein